MRALVALLLVTVGCRGDRSCDDAEETLRFSVEMRCARRLGSDYRDARAAAEYIGRVYGGVARFEDADLPRARGLISTRRSERVRAALVARRRFELCAELREPALHAVWLATAYAQTTRSFVSASDVAGASAALHVMAGLADQLDRLEILR